MRTDKLIYAAIICMCSCSSNEDFDAQGTFEATEITVSAESTGKILSLDINEGDSVIGLRDIGLIDTLQLHLQSLQLYKKRTATLKSRPDITRKAASLRQQISGAKTNRDRLERLISDGAATQQQLDDANTILSSLEGQLSGLLSDMQNNTAYLDESASSVDAQMLAIADQLSKCHIQSPINGIVLTKYAEAGEVASYGTPLFKVADISNMYLRAYFTSDQISELHIGKKVKVLANYGGDNQKEYEGIISYIASKSEFTPKTIQTKDSRANLVYAVKISVKNDGLLKIGLSGNVYVGDNDK